MSLLTSLTAELFGILIGMCSFVCILLCVFLYDRELFYERYSFLLDHQLAVYQYSLAGLYYISCFVADKAIYIRGVCVVVLLCTVCVSELLLYSKFDCFVMCVLGFLFRYLTVCYGSPLPVSAIDVSHDWTPKVCDFILVLILGATVPSLSESFTHMVGANSLLEHGFLILAGLFMSPYLRYGFPTSAPIQAVFSFAAGYSRHLYDARHRRPGKIFVMNGNPVHNANILATWLAGSREFLPSLHGHSICGEITLPFPVFCSERVLRKYGPIIAMYISTDPSVPMNERERDAMLRLFDHTPRVQVITHAQRLAAGAVTFTSLGWFAQLRNSPVSLLYIVGEEIFNDHFTVVPVICFETLMRWGSVPIESQLLVASLHVFLSFIPLPVRVIIHLAWNLHAVNFERPKYWTLNLFDAADFIEDNKESISQVASILSLLKAAVENDLPAALLAIGTQPDYVVSLLRRAGDLSDVASDIISAFRSEINGESGTVILLGPDEDNRGTGVQRLLETFLPVHIRKSRTWKVSATLLTVLVLHSISPRVEFVSGIISQMSGDVFQKSIIGVQSASDFIMVVGSGVKRVYESGNLSDLFDLAPNTRYQLESAKIRQKMTDNTLGVPDWQRMRSALRALQETRYEAKNDGVIGVCYRDNEAAIATLTKHIGKCDMRRMPFFVALLGEPGVAKTTFLPSLYSIAAKIRGDKATKGTSMAYDLGAKYPAPSDVIPSNIRNIHLNDVEENTKEYAKAGKIGLEVALQQLLDNEPLTINNAVAELKGLTYDNVEMIGYTSNHLTTVTGGETFKLNRRMNCGIIAIKEFSHNGRPVDFDTFSTWSVEKRNSSVRYRLMKAACVNNFIRFSHTGVVLDEMAFIREFARRYQAHYSREKFLFEELHGESSKCNYGVPLRVHRHLDDNDCQATRPCLDDCNALELAAQAAPGPTEQEISIMATGNVVTTALGFYMALTTFAYYASVPLFATIFFIATMAGTFCYVFRDQLGGAVHDWWISSVLPRLEKEFQHGVLAANSRIRSYTVYAFFRKVWIRENPSRELAVLRIELLADMRKVKQTFERNWTWILGGATLTALAMYFKQRERPRVIQLAKPIYPDRVHGEMFDPQLRTEWNYDEMVLKQRGWNQNVVPMQQVKLSKLNVNEDNLKRMISSSSVMGKMHYQSSTRPVRILVLSPQYAAINRHYLFKDGKFLSERILLEYPGLGGSQTLEERDVKFASGSEMGVFRFFGSTKGSPLYTYFPEDFVSSSIDISVDGLTWCPAACGERILGDFHVPTLEWSGKGELGDCGTAVMARTSKGNSFLVGAFAFGIDNTENVGATLMSRKWFSEVVEQFGEEFVADVTLLGFETCDELSLNSELRATPVNSIQAIGSIRGEKGTTFKSAFEDTIWRESLRSKLKNEYAIPKGIRGMVGEVYRSAYSNTMKHANLETDGTVGEFYLAMNDYVRPMEAYVKQRGIRLSPLSSKEAFFGNPEIGIGRIDFKTSNGRDLAQHGMRNKYDLFEETGEDEYVFKEIPNAKLEQYWDALKCGVAMLVASEMVPKDEVRPVEKVSEFKIRLFTVISAISNIIQRALFMPLITLMLSIPEISECYGQMNAGSHEWDSLAKRILAFQKFFDADFSSFDTSHAAIVFWAFAHVCRRLAIAAGYTEEAARLVWISAYSLRWQMVVMNGDLFFKFKGMPSGAIITLIMNSVVNSLICRVVFFRLVKDRSDFRTDVALATVGDDNIQGVSEIVADRYNAVTATEQFRRLGYIATPATKTNVVQKFIPFSALTFVRRSFRFEDSIGQYQAPIDTDSIFKALSFQKKDSKLPPYPRLAQVAEGSCREFYLHGREAYEKHVAFLATLPEYNKAVAFKIPSYDELASEYRDGTLTSTMM